MEKTEDISLEVNISGVFQCRMGLLFSLVVLDLQFSSSLVETVPVCVPFVVFVS